MLRNAVYHYLGVVQVIENTVKLASNWLVSMENILPSKHCCANHNIRGLHPWKYLEYYEGYTYGVIKVCYKIATLLWHPLTINRSTVLKRYAKFHSTSCASNNYSPYTINTSSVIILVPNDGSLKKKDTVFMSKAVRVWQAVCPIKAINSVYRRKTRFIDR